MPDGYSADDLTALEGLDAVRKRPGMYIGSTDSKGLVHLSYEIVDNSVDEALAGYCDEITIILHKDGSVEVQDNGRGIPVDINKKTGLSGVALVFQKLHAGGKFGGGGYKSASGGLHGVGASVCNALSQRLDVAVRRSGKIHEMSFHRGVPGVFSDATPEGDFTRKDGLQVTGKMKSGEATGTTVRFWHDPVIFLADAKVEVSAIKARARQTAFLVPGLKVVVVDNTGEKSETEVFQYTGGVVDMVNYLAHDKEICPVIHIQGEGSFKETVPMLDKKGHMISTEVERTVQVNTAFRWGNGYENNLASFVNVVSTPKNGTHVKGFERAVLNVIRKNYEGTRMLKANEAPPILEDALEGLTAVVSVNVPEPQFIGQTKEELGTAGVAKVVQDIISEQFQHWLGKHKQPARTILEKVANASRARLAARTQREAARRKTALEGASMPAKLVDCRAIGVERSELFLVEGDSALGSAKSGRNSEYQALLPLRGKILNVQKASTADMLKNAECASIIQVIGAGSGKTFNTEQMRYGRLILMSVPSNETVLLADDKGMLRLREIGPYVDDCLANGISQPLATTIALDQDFMKASVSPLKAVIKHRYDGTMRHITTKYGRKISVTESHSVFTWENGCITLRTSDQLSVGDILVAPKKLPQTKNPILELDVIALLVENGLAEGVFVTGDTVAEVTTRSAAARLRTSGAAKYADSPRVWISQKDRISMIEKRKEMNLSQRKVANHIGYAQAISVSDWETGKTLPPLEAFKQYLDYIEHEWPENFELKNSYIKEKLKGQDNSKNKRYRSTSATVRLSSLSKEEIHHLDRNVTLSLHARHDKQFPRFMPVTEDLCELLGWFVAEGTRSKGKISFALGRDDEPYMPSLKRAIEKVTGEVPRVYISKEAANKNKRELYFHSGVFSRILKAINVGGYAHEKRVPDLLYNVDSSCQMAFLRGVYLGDGTKRRKAGSSGITIINTVSSELANGISYLLTFLGVVPSLSTRKVEPTEHLGNPINSKYDVTCITVCGRSDASLIHPIWWDSIYANVIYDWIAEKRFDLQTTVEISEDLIGLPILNIEDEAVDEDVYDFSVADLESFVAGYGGGIMAHNSDADVDGSHIRALLVIFLMKYFRPLIEEGRLYSAMPPLHKIETLGRSKEKIYTYTQYEMETTVAKLEKQGKKVKTPVQRYKGLGEMNAEELWETTMNPATRAVRCITLGEAAEAEKMAELLFGSAVEPRRNFIVANADAVENIDA